MIPALAAQTTRLELGTLVSPVTFRPAACSRTRPATANEIAGGRVSLGMGTGWMEAEHEAFGFPFPPMEDAARTWLAEQIEAVGGFWDGRPRPHLIVGGSGLSGTVVPAARWADEYNTILATPEECAARREKIARACEREGREPIPLSLMTGLRDRPGRRRRRGSGSAAGSSAAGQQVDPDEYKAQRGAAAVLGTLEEAAEQPARLRGGGRRARDAAAPRPPRPRHGRADRPRARARVA